MSLRLPESNDFAQNLARTQQFIRNAIKGCDLGGTGVKIQLLTPATFAAVATQHNALQFIKTHPRTSDMGKVEKVMFARAISGRNAESRRLFVGTVFATGDMAFLHYLVMEQSITDGDLPLRGKLHLAVGWESEDALKAFISSEALVCPSPLAEGWFFDKDEGHYQSSLPFATVERNDPQKAHPNGIVAYQVEFNHDIVQDDFERKPYIVTRFSGLVSIPKEVKDEAVAGVLCEGMYFLVTHRRT